MKKTLLLSALSVALLTTANAGFYVGAGVGAQSARNRHVLIDNSSFNRFSTDDQSGVGQLALGYDWILQDRYLLGLEAEGRLGTTESKYLLSVLGNSGLEGEVTRKYALGLAARIGMKFENMKAYVRLGVDWSRTRFKHRNLDNAFRSNTFSVSKSDFGFTPGIGISHSFNQNWDIGLEVRTTFFKRSKAIEAGAKNAGGLYSNPTEIARARIKPRLDTALITLKYFF